MAEGVSEPELVPSGRSQGNSGAARRGGRPKGAKNAVDKDLKRLILHRMAQDGRRTPLEYLTEVYEMTREECIEAGCAFADVLKVKIAAAKAAAPYFHASMGPEKSDAAQPVIMVQYLGERPAAYRDGQLETVDPASLTPDLQRALADDGAEPATLAPHSEEEPE